MARTFKFALGATVRQERVVASDDDMAAVNEQTLNTITAKDVAIFRMDLCNDQIDRHISRFPVDELRTISDELIVGKPLMELHDMPGMFSRGSQPIGKFFRSQIVKDGDTISVRPDVFLLRGHGEDDIIAKIEAGILAGTSISFALDRPECSTCGCDIRDCAHLPGEEIDGELCHVILKEVTEVFEGSIVPLGSQGTEFVEARGADGETVLPLKEAIRQARGAKGQFQINTDGMDITVSSTSIASGDFQDLGSVELPAEPETHPGEETDDELRTSIQESLERVRELPSKIFVTQ